MNWKASFDSEQFYMIFFSFLAIKEMKIFGIWKHIEVIIQKKLEVKDKVDFTFNS